MLFENVSILDENFDVQENYYVGIRGVRITYVGKDCPKEDFGERIPGAGRLLMPAFFNAHAHSPMTLMRGYGENMKLQNWLNDRIFPFEAKLDGNAVYWGTMLGMAESLRNGIVSSSDMYMFTEDVARAVLDSGAKENISYSITNFTGQKFDELDCAKALKQGVANCQGMGDGRIVMEASLHAEYTSNEETARDLAEWTKENGLGMHVHVSETKTEHEECKARHQGRTPVQYLADAGIFDGRAIAAHCVWIEGEDFDILRSKGVTIATNPCSNLKLASGIMNSAKALDEGIRLAIGTDSVASNNSLNMFEEMKLLALLGKVRAEDPTVITPKQALYAATRAGALAQGRMDSGLLKEGFRADLILVRTDVPNMQPVHSMTNNLVYSAQGTDVVMTMADGRVLYKDGEYVTIDVEKTVFEAESAMKSILAAL